MTGPSGVYVYAAVPARTPIASAAPPSDIRLINVGEIGFVVGAPDMVELAAVSDELSQSGGDGVSQSSDLAELARAHDAVIRAVMSVATSVIPFRLATVLESERAVREFGSARATEVSSLLSRLTAASEWGVQVRGAARPRTRPRSDMRASATDVGRPGTDVGRPGTAHLARRRQELADAERSRRDRMSLAAEVSATLRGLAIEVVPNHSSGALALDESYLVREADKDRFLDAADRLGARLADDGLLLRVTGPWPPYSFARLAVGDA